MSKDSTPEELQRLLVPHSPEGMKAYPVSKRVGVVANADAALIEPAGAD
jgi:putative SOS response-associated peptidase YedK